MVGTAGRTLRLPNLANTTGITPQAGMLYFDTTSNSVKYNDGTSWSSLGISNLTPTIDLRCPGFFEISGGVFNQTIAIDETIFTDLTIDGDNMNPTFHNHRWQWNQLSNAFVSFNQPIPMTVGKHKVIWSGRVSVGRTDNGGSLSTYFKLYIHNTSNTVTVSDIVAQWEETSKGTSVYDTFHIEKYFTTTAVNQTLRFGIKTNSTIAGTNAQFKFDNVRMCVETIAH